MKKITFYILLSFLTANFYLSSCGDDAIDEMEEMMEEEEEETIDTVITAVDFIGDLDEVTNPDTQTEDNVIGTINASVNAGTLSFSILSQSVTNAIKVDQSGVIKTNNFSGWDFETNTEITAVVELKAGSVTKDIDLTISINNVTETVSFAGAASSRPSIQENSIFTSHLVQYFAQTDGEIDYSISPDDYFEINQDGKIFVKEDANFDYEEITANGGSAQLEYTVTAFAINNPQINDDINFKPEITDVAGSNEAAERLAIGQTPAQIVNANASLLDSLYGAPYQGGIIATYNNNTGGGLVMTIAGSGTDRTWSQSNSYANGLVKEGYSDWRLMSEAEADVMCAYGTKVSEDDWSGFWTSTNCGGICYEWRNFSNNDACGGGGSPGQFQTWSIVRAVRAY